VGDFDGDAAADVAAALESGAVAVRLGVGNGAFEPAPDVPAGTAPRAVAVADLDDDGDEDLVATDAGAGVVRVRLGDGTGRFSAAPDVPVGADPVDVAVADLNDDGVDDVAVAARGANALSVRPGTGVAALAGNLLQNGGFEGPAPTGKIQPIPAIAGWELEGAWYARYGHASHVYIPSWLAAPRYGTGGGRMLTGGYSAPTDGVTTATQEVDVSASAAAIDDDRARARLSAYLGGAGTHQDAMTARASFLDAGGTALDSLTIGPVRPADRRNATVLLRRAGTARIPRGTRRIRVTMTSFDADKTFSSATADDVKLTLATEPPAGAPTTPASSSDAPPPPPPPPAARFGPRTLVTVSLARRRLRPGRRLVLRVRNANAFAVAGSLRVAGRRRAIRVAARGAATVRLRLPARLRRRRVVVLRPVLVVRNAAGTSRRVTARLRVRITTRTKEVQS
jgi:hypothetical protein